MAAITTSVHDQETSDGDEQTCRKRPLTLPRLVLLQGNKSGHCLPTVPCVSPSSILPGGFSFLILTSQLLPFSFLWPHPDLTHWHVLLRQRGFIMRYEPSQGSPAVHPRLDTDRGKACQNQPSAPSISSSCGVANFTQPIGSH